MKYLPEDFPAMPDRLAQRRLEYFYEQFVLRRFDRYGFGHFALACYAALPSVLTPDLVHKLWLNFKFYSVQGAPAVIHPVAPADLLLSPLFEEVGFEVYEMLEPVRKALLEYLQLLTVSPEKNRFGFQPLTEIAQFLLEYSRRDRTPENAEDDAFREAQEWTALSYLDPGAAFAQVAKAFGAAPSPQAQLRYRDAIEKMSARFEVKVHHPDAEPPKGYPAMRALTQVVRDLALNREKQLEDYRHLFSDPSLLSDQELKAEGVVSIPVPVAVQEKMSAATAPLLRKLRALVVGISETAGKHGTPEGVNDARLFASTLRNGLPQDELIIVELTGKAATRQAILEAWAALVNEATEQDDLFFYLSTNATRNVGGHCLCLCYDSDDNVERVETWLSDADFQAIAGKAVCISVTAVLEVPYAATPHWLDTTNERNLVFATARHSQVPLVLKQKIGEAQRSAFTFALCQVLSETAFHVSNRQLFLLALQKFETLPQVQDTYGDQLREKHSPQLMGCPAALNRFFLCGENQLVRLQDLLRMTGFSQEPANSGIWDLPSSQALQLARAALDLPKGTPKHTLILSLAALLERQEKDLPAVFLFVFSDPDKQMPAIEEEREFIEATFSGLLENAHAELLILPNPTPRELEETFKNPTYRNRIHWFHFAGKIDVFTDKKGRVEGLQLAEAPLDMFKFMSLLDFQQNLRMMVLNACKSDSLAEWLAGLGVWGTVGIKGLVSDKDALDFSMEFYRELAQGKSIENALAHFTNEARTPRNKGSHRGVKNLVKDRNQHPFLFFKSPWAAEKLENWRLESYKKEAPEAGGNKKQRVWGLFVGIDAYRADILDSGATFPRFSGCVNDTSDIYDYLGSDFFFDLQFQFLLNEQATRQALVEAFRNHLSKAEKDDAVLFFFAGLGAQEMADLAIWQDSSYGLLEAIVCFNKSSHSPNFLLTDRELRFLIHELYERTKAHIVTIFDCSFSGSHTRSGFQSEAIERRVDFVFPQRKWEDFIFAEQLTQEDIVGKSLNEALPSGNHIAISASASDEPALEMGGHGVFTSNLVKTLRASGGNLSYTNLHARVRNMLRVNFEQRPQIEVVGLDAQAGFLKKPLGKTGLIVFNRSRGAWMLDKGVVHGIVAGFTTVNLTLDDGKRKLTAVVGEAQFDTATVTGLPPDVDSSTSYTVELDRLQTQVLKICIVNKNTPRELVARLTDRLNTDFISLGEPSANLDFDLVLWNGLYYLTKPGDWFRPVAQPISAQSPDAEKEVEKLLRDISNWLYFNRLTNADPKALPASHLQVDFLKVDERGNEMPLTVGKQNEIHLDLEQRDGGWGGNIKIVITNRSKKNLYVAGVYQSEDFSSTPILFEPQVKMMEPGKSEIAFEHNGGIIPLQLDHKWYWYNWEKGNETIKFIFSEQNFNPGQLEIKALPMPLHPDAVRQGATRGMFSLQNTVLSNWGTVDFSLHISNPTHDIDNMKKAEGMLSLGNREARNEYGGDPSPGFFAAGLYFTTKGFDPRNRIDNEREKGSEDLVNLVLQTQKYWLNRNWNIALNSLKDAPKLLAYGDSWFEHSRLNDVLDYLRRYYPVDLDVTGFWTHDSRRTEKQKPAALLMSCGADEIWNENKLGYYILSNRPQNAKPEEIMNTEEAERILREIMSRYQYIFEGLKSSKMPVIVHGYDYLRPKHSSTKPFFIGNIFHEKGLNDEEGKLVIRFLTDRFNGMLQALCNQYENVHYLDLRGTLNDKQWHDEIHPTDEGFQIIAQRFLEKLNEILKDNIVPPNQSSAA